MQASARFSSSAAFRKVIAGVSSATTRACYRTSRGKAHAARLPAQEPPLKGRKRATMQERKVRIMEFVENYRASNEEMKYNEHSRPKDAGGKTATHDMDTSKTCKTADAPESVIMKDLMDKPDPGNQQREIEANKFDSKNSDKPLNANDSNASDQSGSDIVNEAKTHARDDNPKHEESANMGLLGSLKSFAYGIRNFWKNM